VAGLNPHIEGVLLRALAKDKKDRFANVNDFAVALESAVAGTASVASSNVPRTDQLPGPVSSVPRTQQLLDPVRGTVPRSSTTFTQTAGELDDSLYAPPSRPKWFWAVAVSATVVLLLGAFLLFRPKSAKPVVAGPAPYVPVKRVPVPPAPPVPPPLPVPSATQPEAQPSVSPQVAPGGKKIKPAKPEGKDKKHHQAHGTTPATNSLDGVDHKDTKHEQPTVTPGKENQNKWRVD
jgi:hypothetical protein